MTAKTSAHDELARLGEAIRDANARLDDTRRRAEERLAPLPELVAAEGAAWASGDEPAAEKARKRRAALEEEARTWQVRAQASMGAVDAAIEARRAFIEARGDDLIDEAREDATAARERLERALSDVLDAYAGYSQLVNTLNGYSGDHRRHKRDSPVLSAAAVAVDRALATGLSDPVPGPPIVMEEVA